MPDDINVNDHWSALVASDAEIKLQARDLDSLLSAMFDGQAAIFELVSALSLLSAGDPNFGDARDQALMGRLSEKGVAQ